MSTGTPGGEGFKGGSKQSYVCDYIATDKRSKENDMHQAWEGFTSLSYIGRVQEGRLYNAESRDVRF